METINKISDDEIEIVSEVKTQVFKKDLLAKKARIEALLAEFN